MLTLENPIGKVRGLDVFRDHANPSLFHYVNTRPRIARNEGGRPELVFLKYRRDITDNPAFDPDDPNSLGGGWLSFTVDLSVDDDTLAEVKKELGRHARGGAPKLAAIQATEGTVRLSSVAPPSSGDGEGGSTGPAPSSAMTIFEQVLGATKPSLVGDNRATFSLILSQEGATLVEAGLRSGISPIGVIYELKAPALKPAFEVRVTAEYHRIYEGMRNRFAARGQTGGIALAADIDDAYEKLIDDGSVRVEVLNFSTDEDLRQKAQDAVDWFKNELLKDFFQPTLTPPDLHSDEGGSLLSRLQSLFGGLNSGQTGASPTPQLGNPTQETGTAAAAPQDLSDGVLSTVTANQQAAQAGAASGEQQDSPSVQIQAAYTMRRVRQEELKTRTFEYSMQQAVDWDFGAQGNFATLGRGFNLARLIREVDLDDEFFKRLVATVSVAGDLSEVGITALNVSLEYPGGLAAGEQPSHTDGFVFRPGQTGEHTFNSWLNEKKDLSYRWKQVVHFAAGSPWQGPGATVEGPWHRVRDRRLVLDPLDDVALFEIRAIWGALDEQLVKQAQVELKYTDAQTGFSVERTVLLAPTAGEQSLKLRLADVTRNEFSYRITYVLSEGLRHTTEWATSRNPSLIVNSPFLGTLRVRVVPLLDPVELLEALLEITYAEESGYQRRVQKVYSADDLQRGWIEIPTLAEHPSAYTYDLTVVRMDGSEFRSGRVETDRALIAVADGEGTAKRLEVRLTDTNLAGAGLAAVRVRVETEGEFPDADEVLFLPSRTEPRTLTLVEPEGAERGALRWTVTGYTTRGEAVPGATGEESGRTLLVGLPAAR